MRSRENAAEERGEYDAQFVDRCDLGGLPDVLDKCPGPVKILTWRQRYGLKTRL